MMGFVRRISAALIGETGADRVVPASGAAAQLTVLVSACIAFLAVFALSLALAAGTLAQSWSTALASTATVRVSAPIDQMQQQLASVSRVLETTPGIASFRTVEDAEKLKLLEPWLGEDLPAAALALPGMIAVTEEGAGPDLEGLLLRLKAEAPAAVWDDHERWRLPLVTSADQLRWVTLLALALIAATFVAIVTLATQSALAANLGVIGTLRLVGATDTYIARAFVRRFTLRAVLGATIGTALCMILLVFLPRAAADSFLPSLRYNGFAWLLPLTIPVIAGVTAFVATRRAAMHNLKTLS